MEDQEVVTTAYTDPVTVYAEMVAGGQILAGPHVRHSCERHLRDLDGCAGRGLIWSPDAARRTYRFFEGVLKLNGGDYEGKPFLLIDWQIFILGSLFGWLREEDGKRRFRSAYIETGKGSGKSPLLAGIGLYCMAADGEPRAEVYSAASTRDQAQILFRDAVAMVRQSPMLHERAKISGAMDREWNISWPQTHSFFRPIASDSAQSGPRPHCALLDEIHEHRNGSVVSLMRAGTKSRKQALIVMITNSGHDKTSVCYEHHRYGAHVAAGQVQDDAYFSYVCGLDEGEEKRILDDESLWVKSNPSLAYGIPGYRYLREQVTEARGMPSKESIVKRLNFCIWTDAENPFITSEIWFGSQDQDFPVERLLGRRCWGGLDLSSTLALTALALVFEPSNDDRYWRYLEYYWLPKQAVARKENKENVQWRAWIKQGHVRAMPGYSVDRGRVAKEVAEIVAPYNLQTIAYDRWRIEEFQARLEADGIDLPMEAIGQGFRDISPALEELEVRFVSGTARHSGNPCTTWNVANAVMVSDDAGNRKFSKQKSTGDIDGVAAMVMATGASIDVQRRKKKRVGVTST